MQAVLCITAGALLVGQGLLALGIVRRNYSPNVAGGGPVCLAGTFVGPFLGSPHLSHVLLAGVLTGFLPCGLVYGYLALASSLPNILDGLLTMSLFGAGTAPLMIAAGMGSSLVSGTVRRKLLKVAAICVSLTGLISILRGILFVQLTAAPEVVRCVLCGVSGR
jgi:sulfite exporter TauE/SafE